MECGLSAGISQGRSSLKHRRDCDEPWCAGRQLSPNRYRDFGSNSQLLKIVISATLFTRLRFDLSILQRMIFVFAGGVLELTARNLIMFVVQEIITIPHQPQLVTWTESC
jgi:hypothetical protein